MCIQLSHFRHLVAELGKCGRLLSIAKQSCWFDKHNANIGMQKNAVSFEQCMLLEIRRGEILFHYKIKIPILFVSPDQRMSHISKLIAFFFSNQLWKRKKYWKHLDSIKKRGTFFSNFTSRSQHLFVR